MTPRIDPGRWEQYGRMNLPHSGIFVEASHRNGRKAQADVTVLDSSSLREWLHSADGNAEALCLRLLGHPPVIEPGSSTVPPPVNLVDVQGGE